MKFLIFISTIGVIGLVLVAFSACSSRTQTNKLPNDTIYHLPESTRNQIAAIASPLKDDYDEALMQFFKVREQEEEEKNIFDVGLKGKYFK